MVLTHLALFSFLNGAGGAVAVAFAEGVREVFRVPEGGGAVRVPEGGNSYRIS